MASRSWNRVELIGNLTRDPELRYTPNGAAVATFGIATNRTYVVEGERKEEVYFHRLVAWNKLAELCTQLLKKGTRAFISGRLQYREWETQDGQKRGDAEIVMEDLIVLTSRNGSFADEEMETEGGLESPSETAKAETGPAKETAEKSEAKEKPAPKASADETVSPDEDLPF